jgi:penicillin G amidase
MVLVGLVAATLLAGYALLRGSLPQLDGRRPLHGLAAAVRVQRDALGVPRISGANRIDLARASGFLHAQERYFQMDLLRRRAAGELAALVGTAAVSVDRSTRVHGFRRLAGEVVNQLDARQRQLLEAYVQGVNAGLAALAASPWEYQLLRVTPRPWRAEDSILCIYAMWLDLQDEDARYDRSLEALRDSSGESAVALLAGLGAASDAPLDGSLVPPLTATVLRRPPSLAAAAAGLGPIMADRPGSNSLAVAGAHTASGAAMLANDMHLGLRMPNVWYRASLEWPADNGSMQRVVGAMLPGTPAMVVGSNGHVAWGFTNSYIDTVDAVVLELRDARHYRVPGGWREIGERVELIEMKGAPTERLIVRTTQWGPLITAASAPRQIAVWWNAHHAVAANYNLLDLETADTVDAAIDIGHRAGMPNQNMLIADSTGRIAWTLTGAVPRRRASTGRLPHSWAGGEVGWDGWLAPKQVPVIADPAAGLLWTANNRIVGDEALALLGDGGYDSPLRARSIRDELRVLVQSKPQLREADLLGVQLSDRAAHLDRWRDLLLQVLDEQAVSQRPARAMLRELARTWNGRASTDSVGYRVIRSFRDQATGRVLAPYLMAARARMSDVDFGQLRVEDAVWQIVAQDPAPLLVSVDAVLQAAGGNEAGLKAYTWGQHNTLRMRHPLSVALPGWLGGWLDMTAQSLPGDREMARVQGPDFGASQRMVVSPGHEEQGIFHMPGGQSGHPLSPYYGAGHDAWVQGSASPLLPGSARYTLELTP